MRVRTAAHGSGQKAAFGIRVPRCGQRGPGLVSVFLEISRSQRLPRPFFASPVAVPVSFAIGVSFLHFFSFFGNDGPHCVTNLNVQ